MINLLFTGIQTIFLRAHNLAAKAIHEAKPALFDDAIYEIAREFVNAIFQRIAYKEWLPILLGPTATAKYLSPVSPTAQTTYNKDVSHNNFKA